VLAEALYIGVLCSRFPATFPWQLCRSLPPFTHRSNGRRRQFTANDCRRARRPL